MLKHEIHRKGIHIASALIPLSSFFIPRDTLLFLLLLATIFFVSIDFLRRFLPGLQLFFGWIAGYAMREAEEQNHKLTGASWVLIGYLATLFLFPLTIAVPAMLILAWCDAAAALVGQSWGKIHWYKEYTVEGALAFILIGFAIFLIGFPDFPLWQVAIVVILTAFGETFVSFLDDNLFIPLFSASLLFLLNGF
jgi:dolichol kinase